ncbi:MAG: DUF6498-containing protein [bacterium]|nr:DUF6498-containing protein [bacterium]
MNLKRALADPLIYILLLVNIGLAYGYFKHFISAETVLFTYFSQSLVMGISYFIQMITLTEYSVKDVSVNNQPLVKSTKTKGCLSFFFLFHYGFFHFVYLIFLFTFIGFKGHVDMHFIYYAILTFAVGETLNIVKQKFSKEKLIPNIGTLMFTPYLRIIPMHFFILIGGFIGHQNATIFMVFIILKILSDIAMHIVVNKTYLNNATPSTIIQNS